MMKNLKLWQKAGLATLVALPLALGLGFTTKHNSQGLESKIPSIGMGMAEAKETNPQGYEVPDLTGKMPDKTIYKETDQGFVYKGEIFLNVNEQTVIRLSRDGKTFGYVIDENGDKKMDYTIIDDEGDGKFESKYNREEEYPVPGWVR